MLLSEKTVMLLSEKNNVANTMTFIIGEGNKALLNHLSLDNWTKLLQFPRRHEWKVLYSDENFTEVCS